MKTTTERKSSLRTQLTSGKILKSWLIEKIAINPSYSLRAMSRNLGVSPGFLSLVLADKKKLSLDRAIQFSQVLKLDPKETEALIQSATLGKARAEDARKFLEKLISQDDISSDNYTFMDVERFKILSEWYHLAVLDLSQTRGFKADPRWIASRLKISQLQAGTALQRLIDLGLLIEKDGKLKKVESRIAFVAKQSHAAVREYHKQMISKGLGALSDATPEAFEKRSITGMTLAVDPKLLPEAYEMIDSFRRNMERFLTRGDQGEVYQLNVQLFNLSHPIKEQ